MQFFKMPYLLTVMCSVLLIVSACSDEPQYVDLQSNNANNVHDASNINDASDVDDSKFDASDVEYTNFDTNNLNDDTALPDTELSDAALPDTELSDAALPDTELSDAALPDTELPDAALPDTALPDAALPCDGACSGTTPYCEEVTDSCVACLSDSHCPPDTIRHLVGICVLNACEADPNQCLPGFVDLDGKVANGCECEITNENDIPDINGKDTNCDGTDGISGENGNVIFVSLNGNAQNSGFTSDKPLPTITAGIARAKQKSRPYVLVAAGDYAESITLENGISIFGGYDPTTWKRKISTNETLITGNGTPDSTTKHPESGLLGHYKTVTAKNITAQTTLSGLIVVGQDAAPSNFSASTIALWAENSTNLAIQDSLFIGGKASKGAAGKNGKNATAQSCSPRSGGTGGTSSLGQAPCFNPYYGTDVGEQGKPGQTGISGAPTPPTHFNGGQYICGSWKETIHASIGHAGPDGDAGTNSQPAPANYLGEFAFFPTHTTWLHPPHSELASKGIDGTGGQGGGAGGDYEWQKQIGRLSGGHGGKGGSGGCGGEPAQNGYSGGSSFGIVVLDGKVTFHKTSIELGTGGDGGLPGTHGKGTAGKTGSNGAYGETHPSFGPAGNGGKGGPGGKGGDGGKAIGGIGGHAIGLAYIDPQSIVGAETILYDTTTGPAKVGQGQNGWKSGQKTDGKILESHQFPTTP